MKTRKQFSEWDHEFSTGTVARRGTVTTATMVSEVEASVEQSHVGSDGPTYFGNIQPIEMRLSDEKLMETAVNAAKSIPWSTLHRDVVATGTRWERKQAADDDVAVFTKTDESAGRFAVLTVSEMQCSLHELQEIMLAPSASAFTQLMTEIWGNQFKHGDLLHEVGSTSGSQRPWNPQLTQSLVRSHSSGNSDSNTKLTLKHAVFEKPRMFSNNEEWFYLDLLKGFKDNGNSQREMRNVFTKTTVSLHPDQLLADSSRHYQHAQLNGSTICGLLLEEEPSGQMTRVRVYAEGSLRGRKKRSWLNKLMGNGSAASFRSQKNRVMGATKITSALLTLVRRRQLGLQRFTMASSMHLYDHLTAMQAQAQAAFSPCPSSSDNELEMSGFSVASSAYSREMERVDESQPQCEKDLIEMHIAATSRRRETARTESTCSSSSSVLADLLEDTMISATGRARQASVLKVIKGMVEQDEAELNGSFVSSSTKR